MLRGQQNIKIFRLYKITVTAAGCKERPRLLYRPKRKGTAIPLQAWTGPGISRRLRLPDFKAIST